jgi:hypothetical protein
MFRPNIPVNSVSAFRSPRRKDDVRTDSSIILNSRDSRFEAANAMTVVNNDNDSAAAADARARA